MESTASFGYWLKRRRKALDLTQATLAQQVGCAVVTIRKIEADEIRPSVQIAQKLAECLAIPTEERAAFLQVARAERSTDRLALPTEPVERTLVKHLADAAAVALLPTDQRSLPSGTVTFLFTDIEGSTTLWEQHPQAMRVALARHDAILRAAVERHAGVIFKTVGDAICAAFASAPEALWAAQAAQRALQSEDWGVAGPLRVRMALHTGTAEAHYGDYVGPPLNRIARLMAAGHGGQVLLSRAVQELVRDDLPPGAELRDLGEHRLKDLTRPEQIFQVVVPDLPADFPPLHSLDRQPHNLPVQLTALIGREREVAAVCALLRRVDVRLVTLSGPGGAGKTRLAIQAAAELLDQFADGIFFVSLAPISDPALVAPTIAQAFDVREVGGQSLLTCLKAALRNREALLVLDNFEQVLAVAALIAELLAAAYRLKVLVTSRAVLHLSGEHEYAVPPLTLPDYTHLPSLERLTQYETVRLFIERAQAVQPDFQITNANAPAVAEICMRLDGLPLAIELAAARSKLFNPQALLARLERRLPLLTGGARDLPARHQTLRNTIDWSYTLLNAGERTLFARLAIFAGGCTFETAETVCNAAADLPIGMLDGLAALIDQSLLHQEEQRDGQLRFVMLETIREYALERLAESGEEAAVRERHAAYYLALVEATEPLLSGPEQMMWLSRLEIEHANLHTVLVSVLGQKDLEIALRLTGALGKYWFTRGHLSEGRKWLETTLTQGTDAVLASQPPEFMRTKVLNWASNLAGWQGDFAQAIVHAAASLMLSREFGNKQGMAYAFNNLGLVAYFQGDNGRAQTFYEESLVLFRELSDREGMALVFNNLGNLPNIPGNNAHASALHQASLALKREMGDQIGIAQSLDNLGWVAMEQGDDLQAQKYFIESLALVWELKHKLLIADILGGLGWVAGVQGHPQRAARLLGAEESLRDTIGAPLPPSYDDEHARCVAPARVQLDEATFAAEWAAGRAMSLEQAVDYALAGGIAFISK